MKYDGKEYYSQGDIYAAIEEQNKLLKEENKKLKSDLGTAINERDNNIKLNKKLENRILKLGIRIYQNIDGEKRKEYQEYCKRHRL